MGVYDSGIDFNIGGDLKKNITYIILAIVAVVIIGGIFFTVSEYVKPQAIEFRFENNPIKTSQGTKLYVKITNTIETDLANVPLTVLAKEQTEFDIYPLNEKFDGQITNLSSKTSREITYVINPVGEILPGTYVIVAKTTLNGTEHKRETTLRVE